jgi:hypothetical protein
LSLVNLSLERKFKNVLAWWEKDKQNYSQHPKTDKRGFQMVDLRLSWTS